MDKRQRIIQAARARFRHYGIQKTTMQEVAGDADVAVGTLYRYFKDKDDLVVACADDFVARHQGEIDAILGSERSPDDKLRGYILGRYRHCREVGTASQHAAELARAVIRVKPERRQDEAAMMQRTIMAIILDGKERGIYHCPDPERYTMVFLLSIAFFFPTATMDLVEWPKEEWLLMVLDWFIDVWKRPRDSAPAKKTKKFPPLAKGG